MEYVYMCDGPCVKIGNSLPSIYLSMSSQSRPVINRCACVYEGG